MKKYIKAWLAAVAVIFSIGMSASIAHAADADIKIINASGKPAYLTSSSCSPNCYLTSWGTLPTNVTSWALGTSTSLPSITIKGSYQFDAGGSCTFSFTVSDSGTCSPVATCSGRRASVTKEKECKWGMGTITYTVE